MLVSLSNPFPILSNNGNVTPTTLSKSPLLSADSVSTGGFFVFGDWGSEGMVLVWCPSFGYAILEVHNAYRQKKMLVSMETGLRIVNMAQTDWRDECLGLAQIQECS
jgi:hypothetical protein